MKKKTEIRQFFDDEENRLIVHNGDKTVKLFLKLKAEGFRRRIGTITKSTKTLRLTRDRSKHLHFKSNSYGFNHHVLKEGKLFDKISLSDQHEAWKIPKDYILEHGKFLFFKNQGFELQTFLSLEELNQFKINTKKTRF